MKRYGILLILLSLCACQTPQQAEALRQAQVERDNATCGEYGFKSGSAAFANCRLQLDLVRQQRADYYAYDPYPYPDIQYNQLYNTRAFPH